MLAGVNAGLSDLEDLKRLADNTGDGHVIVERARTDFTRLLENCAVSISQGGYNTLMETLQARARAVVVPFSGDAETEQGLRAQLFSERGLIEVLHEDALTPKTLAASLDRAASRPRAVELTLDLEGAKCTAGLVAGWTANLSWQR